MKKHIVFIFHLYNELLDSSVINLPKLSHPPLKISDLNSDLFTNALF